MRSRARSAWRRPAVVGHDIGLMVAYAYAAQFPAEVEKLVVMDAFLPGVGEWEAVYNNPAFWHFRFNGPTPEELVQGRERVYFDHFWNDFAADKTRSIPEADRKAYTTAYARPGRMRAGWAYFVSFTQAAKDFAQFAQTQLTMPVLAIGGEKSLGELLGQQMKLVAPNVTVVVLKDTGHWVLEERPKGDDRCAGQSFSDRPEVQLKERYSDVQEIFIVTLSLGAACCRHGSSLPEMRMTPAEIRPAAGDDNQIGSSRPAGVHTTGTVSAIRPEPGFYAILLFVPAHTTIQAHSHRDDRVATVVAGEWHFGYGDHFDEKS